jgi:hypothetical protein
MDWTYLVQIINYWLSLEDNYEHTDCMDVREFD